MYEVVFSHWGLATATLVHALLTLVTGLVLVAERYGYPPRGRWRSVVRVAHTALGVLMVGYLVATYVVVPF
jgi:peptidoglycan biosynthesis protein MviN/MurJ (putative lipid II flippase)